MKIEIDVVCSKCGGSQMCWVEGSFSELKMTVRPCETCLEKNGDERFTAGYELGYDDRKGDA